MSALRHWVRQVAIAVDQLGTALVGGWADETLSSYAWRMEQQGKPWGAARPVIDAAFTLFGLPDHCQRAYEAGRLRRQKPLEQR